MTHASTVHTMATAGKAAATAPVGFPTKVAVSGTRCQPNEHLEHDLAGHPVKLVCLE